MRVKNKTIPIMGCRVIKNSLRKRRSEKQNFFKRITVYELTLELFVEMSQGRGFTVTALGQ